MGLWDYLKRTTAESRRQAENRSPGAQLGVTILVSLFLWGCTAALVVWLYNDSRLRSDDALSADATVQEAGRAWRAPSSGKPRRRRFDLSPDFEATVLLEWGAAQQKLVRSAAITEEEYEIWRENGELALTVRFLPGDLFNGAVLHSVAYIEASNRWIPATLIAALQLLWLWLLVSHIRWLRLRRQAQRVAR